MDELQEAITIKAQARQMLRATRALLANKSLPAALKDDLDKVELALRRTWDDLQAEMDAEDAPAKDDEPEPKADAEEAAEIEMAGDVVALQEGAVRKDGTVTVKVIAPGWGSSGYYAPDVLARDGSKVFTKGTKMFWDHATASQEADRPEGELDRLAGEFLTDAAWNEDGKAGPGLYADAKVFGRYRDAVAELAPHIGVSIRAMGKAKEGEADGKRGPVIQSFTAARSVDFVTTPGAGGKIISLFEAARQAPREERKVTEEEAAKLTAENEALKGEVATLRQALVMREAVEFVEAQLTTYELPEAARERLLESLAAQPALVDGALDRDAYQAQIEERAKAEMAYIANLTGAGQIRGLGAVPAPRPAADALFESYRNFFVKSGKSAEEAERLAKIAAQGR
jgi:hypothetical protein